MHYDRINSFLFVNARKIYQSKARDYGIIKHPLRLGNVSVDFSANNMKQKTGLMGCVYDFSVNHKAFYTSNIIDIHKYLMNKHDIKQSFELSKKCLLYC